MDEQKPEQAAIIPFDQEVLFTLAEASRLLKINRGKMYELVDRGLIRVTKLGRRKNTKNSNASGGNSGGNSGNNNKIPQGQSKKSPPPAGYPSYCKNKAPTPNLPDIWACTGAWCGYDTQSGADFFTVALTCDYTAGGGQLLRDRSYGRLAGASNS